MRHLMGVANSFSLQLEPQRIQTILVVNIFLFIFGLVLIALGLWGGKFVPPRPVDTRMAAGLLAGVAGVVISIQALSRLI